MKIILAYLPSFLLLFSSCCFSQDDKKPIKKKSKFQTGIYLGSYFSNKHTSSLYDGYGYDLEGKKNNFPNSFMYRKIVLELGGVSGQTDYVAQALGVSPGEWEFDQTDMPMNVKYNPNFMVGINFSYAISKKDALLLDINASKLTLSGNFTIVITAPPIGPQPPGYQNIQAFAITGSEQRLLFHAGCRRIVGEDEIFNFFVEGGASLNMTKYLRNHAAINSLPIDLGTFYSQPYYPTYRAKYLNGIGMGAFAGLGLNIAANSNWSIQLLYSPSYEKINIGELPKLTLHHSAGMRTFYTL
ncbi:MAG: hypothetical protein EPN85_06210 [Bacteroidetes bacterium]|nr:MAG: hypothetical protein EPN85_06210 [Bacteroidota bacterium]